jgi:hypothetical protein
MIVNLITANIKKGDIFVYEDIIKVLKKIIDRNYDIP